MTNTGILFFFKFSKSEIKKPPIADPPWPAIITEENETLLEEKILLIFNASKIWSGKE